MLIDIHSISNSIQPCLLDFHNPEFYVPPKKRGGFKEKELVSKDLIAQFNYEFRKLAEDVVTNLLTAQVDELFSVYANESIQEDILVWLFLNDENDPDYPMSFVSLAQKLRIDVFSARTNVLLRLKKQKPSLYQKAKAAMQSKPSIFGMNPNSL